MCLSINSRIMVKKLFKLFAILLVIQLSFVSNSEATHMMGSDFSWKCIGQDSFLVKLVIYRDCNGVQLSAASIPIKCASSGASITILSIAKPAPIDITPTCAASCNRCQTGSCSFPYGVEKYVFQKLVILSSAGSCCEVIMSYSMCCRNSTITTGAGDKNYYIDAKLNRCLNPCDNSPEFSIDPIIIMCINQDFSHSMGTIEQDTFNGQLIDSLSFEWTKPLSGKANALMYTGQYAYNKPIYFYDFPDTSASFPKGLHLNNATGELQFRPMKIEQTVMAIKVKQWRKINGVTTNIGYTRRDLQFIIINCPNNHVPAISGVANISYACVGDSVYFNFITADSNSQDSLTIGYNYSLPGATWTSTNGQTKRPTATLAWKVPTGYMSSIPLIFTISVSDGACPIPGSISKDYRLIIDCDQNMPIMKDMGGGEFHFYTNGDTTNKTFKWEGLFSQGFLETTPSFNYKFKFGGKYPYKLTINQGSISEEVFIDTVIVFPLSEGFDKTDVRCNGENTGAAKFLIDGGKQPFSFLWSNGDTLQTAKKLVAGIYSVVATDASGVKVTDTVKIYEPQKLSYSIDSIKHVSCGGGNNGFAFVNVKNGTPPYFFNWQSGDSTNYALNLRAGYNLFTLVDNCQSSFTDSVLILEPSKIITDTEILTAVRCRGESTGYIKVKTSGGNYPYYYSWNNGNKTNEIANLASGIYRLTTRDMANCEVIDTFVINEPEVFELNAVVLQEVSCAGSKDGSAELTNYSGGTKPYSFNWTNGVKTSLNSGLTAGTYAIVGIDSCGNVAADTVVLEDGPYVKAEQINGNSSVKVNMLQIYSVTENPEYNYNWQVTNGNIYAGQASKSVAVEWDNVGIGLVELIVDMDQRCYDTSSLAVNVVLTVDEELAKHIIHIYPNPVKDKLFIDMDDFVNGQEYKIEIIDSYGRLHYNEILPNKKNSLSVLNLPNGMYILKTTDSNNHSSIYKFSKAD